MKKFIFSITALFLALSLCACNTTNTEVNSSYNKGSDIQATEKTQEDIKIESVEYQISRQDNSYRNTSDEILIENYYDQVILKGDSESISLINNTISDNMHESFLKPEDMQNYAQHATSEFPYRSNYTAEVTHNANGYISIKMLSLWYMGGVNNSIWYGMTFNLNTGSPATLTELTEIDSKTLEAQLKEKTWSYLTTEHKDELFAEAYNTLQDYTLDKFDFYVENGEIVLLFPVYTFAPGVVGSMTVPTGVYINIK